ncbi:unnamed protein product [Tenebrio molitor]|nr:unnamed protein product [Tenebrio molitor]
MLIKVKYASFTFNNILCCGVIALPKKLFRSQSYSETRQTTMAPTLYMIAPSPAVRAVQITAKAIGLELNLKELDFMKGEHMQPEYLKLNPQHTVPTLVEEDGFTLWDSHAINVYLVSKYAKNDNLYPKDLKKRALVDQRLHFDTGVAFARGLPIVGAILRAGKTSLEDSEKESINQVYGFLEAFLDGKQYMAGDSVTIADYSLFATITGSNALVAIDAQKYPRLTKWLKTIETRPEAELNPQHTVPTLVDDDGFTLSDSHAIMIYLLSKYAKNDNLYPKDLKKRALVDQRLHFDSGVAYATALSINGAIVRAGKTRLNDSDKESLSEVYSFSETFLEGKQYMVGDCVTIADYSLFAIITTLNVLFAIDIQKYPRLAKWLKDIDSRPEAEINPQTHRTHSGRRRRFHLVGQPRHQRLPRLKVRQERQTLHQGFEKEGAGGPETALRQRGGFRQRCPDYQCYFWRRQNQSKRQRQRELEPGVLVLGGLPRR